MSDAAVPIFSDREPTEAEANAFAAGAYTRNILTLIQIYYSRDLEPHHREAIDSLLKTVITRAILDLSPGLKSIVPDQQKDEAPMVSKAVH